MKRLGSKIPSAKFLALLCLPMIVALGISGYLTYVSVTASEIAGCGGGAIFDCGHVLYSKWSKFAGFPVSGMALATYVAMIVATMMTGWNRLAEPTRQWAWTAVSGLAIAASMAAVYFICLQVFVLKHLCSYCLVAHSCGLLIAMSILCCNRVSLGRLSSVSTFAAAGLAMLIAVQVNSEEPKKYKIETFQPLVVPTTQKKYEAYVGAPGLESTHTNSKADSAEDDLFAPPCEDDLFMPPSEDDLFDPPVEDDDDDDIETVDFKLDLERTKKALADAGGVSMMLFPRSTSAVMSLSSLLIVQEANKTKQASTTGKEVKQKKERRVVAFLSSSGETKLDVAQWPLVGSQDAKHVFVEMFDYTCPHCRSTYGAIRGAKKTLGDDVSVVLLPVPLSSACNPLITKNNPAHAESCQLSKLAISVWRVDAEKFNEFHDWMFESDLCPNYSMALTKAIELIGKDAMEAELNKSISAKYIERNVQLYQRVGGGEVPKLLFPTTTVVGEFTSTEQLADLIRTHAGN